MLPWHLPAPGPKHRRLAAGLFTLGAAEREQGGVIAGMHQQRENQAAFYIHGALKKKNISEIAAVVPNYPLHYQRGKATLKLQQFPRYPVAGRGEARSSVGLVHQESPSTGFGMHPATRPYSNSEIYIYLYTFPYIASSRLQPVCRVPVPFPGGEQS